MNAVKKRAAELLARYSKSNPTGSAVHVPAPMGEPAETEEEKKKRRQRAAVVLGYDGAPVAKAPDSAQYIGRSVLNADQLAAWWAQTAAAIGDTPTACDPNPHITVAFSQKEFDWEIDRSLVVIQPDAFVGLGLLGPDKAVVLFLDSPLLESRWQATKDAGATWDFDGYKPHVTLCYLGADADVETFRDGPLPDFPIVLGPELMAKGGAGVFEAVKAPDWYQTANGVQT